MKIGDKVASSINNPIYWNIHDMIPHTLKKTII